MAKISSYVYARGKTYGPYNDAELSGHIEAGRIPFSSWIHRDGQWALLAESAELRVKHPQYEDRPAAAPSKADSVQELASMAPAADLGVTMSAESFWFVIRDKKKHGPYSAADLVGQLQNKELESGAFVWRPGFPTWQKMSSLAEFSRRAVQDNVDVLVKRKFPRAPFEVEVIAHDNNRAIEGKTIAEGGLFLATARPAHAVGTRLKIHFRESDAKIPSFNAVAEVVSVVRGGDMPGYCMRFVAISDADRRRIAKFVSDKK